MSQWSDSDLSEKAIVVMVGVMVVVVAWLIVFQTVSFFVCGCSNEINL